MSFVAVKAEDTLEQRVQQLEQRVEYLEHRLESLSSQVAAPGISPPLTVSAKSLLTLENWHYRTVQVKFNTYYALDITLHNGYEQAIKELEGRIQFRNLLGNHLYSFTLSQSLPISAGQTLVDEGSQQNRRLLGAGHLMRKFKPDELAAELIIKKIVFEDNSVLTF